MSKSPRKYGPAGQRIQEARERLGLTQEALAAQLQIKSRQVLQHWESGKALPRALQLRRLCEVLGLDERELLDGTPDAHPRVAEEAAVYEAHGEVRRIPVISWVAASHFHTSADPYQPGDGQDYTYAVNVSASSFALRVRGPSMQPRFNDGDLIVVDPERQAKAGDFVIVARGNSEDATFKELAQVDGQFWLRPLNPQFQAIPMPTDARVCGVVVRRIENF